MPVSTQIERLRVALAARGGAPVLIESVDLVGLEETERAPVLDAMVAGDESPFVVVGGRLVCTGSVDVERVLDALPSPS